MTTLNPILARQTNTVAIDTFYELRWSGAMTKWTDRFGALRDSHTHHGRIAFVITLQLLAKDRGLLEAWLDLGGRRQSILAPVHVVCDVLRHDSMVHIDAHAEGANARRLLAVSFVDHQDKPAFAQSPLLAEAGLPGGAWDPPTSRRVTSFNSVSA
ncbi:MAG TPA: hypothetical protein PK098_10105 [Phycisphaerales bacterium]|nr:hypothetical protein [Phycisphaerales bacterium]